MYRLITDDLIEKIGTGIFFTSHAAGTIYAEYLGWLAEGNTPEGAPIPSPAPTTESQRALGLLLKLIPATDGSDIAERSRLRQIFRDT